MILTSPFTFNTIRNTHVALARLFSGMQFYRQDQGGNIVQQMKIPLSLNAKRHWYNLLTEKGEVQGNMVANQMPRLTLDFNTATYNQARQLNRTTRNYNKNHDLATIFSQLRQVPYIFDYDLNIFTKNQDDGFRIVEQILPYFAPSLTVTVNDIPKLNILRDVNIVLKSVENEKEYLGSLLPNQLVIWTLNFEVYTNVYLPVTDAGVIKKIFLYLQQNQTIDGNTEEIKVEVDPSTANEWDVDSNGNPAYNIISSIVNPYFDSNGQGL